jgi:hypothetical protein
VGLVGPDLSWLLNLTFLTAYEPQRLVADQSMAWAWTVPAGETWIWGGLAYQSVLLGLGSILYAAAAFHFCRRDLPAPL